MITRLLTTFKTMCSPWATTWLDALTTTPWATPRSSAGRREG